MEQEQKIGQKNVLTAGVGNCKTTDNRCCRPVWKVIFKAAILVCVMIFTAANAYYYFWFLPEQRDYNRAESKRYECKQDVQSLISQYNSVASSFDQTKPEDQQSLYNFAKSLGIVDDQGNPLDNQALIEKCIKGEL